LAVPVHGQRSGSPYGAWSGAYGQSRRGSHQARQILLDGKDPIQAKHSARAAGRSAKSMLFKDAARKFIELHESRWKNPRHRQQWRDSLRDYADSPLGSRPISAIDAALITEVLAPIWQTRPGTARRVKQRIERVCQWVRDGIPNGATKRNHFPVPAWVKNEFSRLHELGTSGGLKSWDKVFGHPITQR
jgi:integrase-like protein